MNVPQDIHIPSLMNYLIARDWKQVSEEPRIWENPEGQIFHIPLSVVEPVNAFALGLVLQNIASKDQIFNIEDLIDRTKTHLDILYFGCEIPNSKPGHLPIKRGKEYYNTATQMIRDTAESHPSGSGNVEYLMNHSYFGEVIAASYSVAVKMELPPIPSPLGRAVLSRITYRFDALIEALITNDIARMVDDGLGAWTPKMCDLIYEFIERTHATQIKIKARPDPLVKTDHPVITDELEAETKPEHAGELLREASSHLVDLKERQVVTIEGMASIVKDNSVAGGASSNTVHIYWIRPDKGPVSVIVELTPDLFTQCLDSMKSKTPIKVSGRIRQRGTRWYLEDPSQFEFNF